MLPWFLRDAARLDHERQCIDELVHSADWLIGCEWLVTPDLSVDAVVRAHGHDYNLRLTYPGLFPAVPAVVRPLGESQHLSGHQYGGPDGPLCLQWGPDNWQPHITGADMLLSANELLVTEDPAGASPDGPRIAAPSRHHLTLGQEVRSALVRWYLASSLSELVISQSPGSHGQCSYSLRNLNGSFVCLVHSVSGADGEQLWIDDRVPDDLPCGTPTKGGVWIRTSFSPQAIRAATSLTDLDALFGPNGPTPWSTVDSEKLVPGDAEFPSVILLMDDRGECHLSLVVADGELVKCTSLTSPSERTSIRAPHAATLRDKSVAIVGLGSAGSKIALSLARMGVGAFYLVDHDVMLPENLRRHTLDWQSVTQHKSKAVGRSIRFIDASIKITSSHIHLTGQESNAVVAAELKKIAECDLLIDATANSGVFNMIAAASGAAGKPMVWMEIYGGGVGGLVARSRPGIDPGPLDMRASYLHFCEANPAPPEMVLAPDYDLSDPGDHEPLSASDADVAVIAHHAARLATDSLLPEAQSRFPHSLYLVGLDAAWVFVAPFATIPLSMSSLPPSPAAASPDTSFSDDALAFLNAVFSRTTRE